MNDLILVPLDGSDHAFKALDFAGDLAEKYDSTLILVHVVPDAKIPEGLQRWTQIENVHEAPSTLYEQNVAEGILETGQKRLGKRTIASVQHAIERGDAAKGILKVAERKKVDLIVMATRGLSDIQGLIFGSVAHKVSHAANCTVISVR